MSEKLDKSTLTSALPESLKNDEGVRVVCAGVDPQTQALGAVAMREPWISMVGNERVQNLSSNELDHIAYTLGSHVWIADWTVEQKRAYVSRIIPLKRVAGTAYAIQNAFAQLGYIAQVADAQTSPTMVPGTFTVYLVDQPVPADDQWTLFWIVDQIKPASRPWRWESRTNASTDAEVYSAARPVVWANIDAEIIQTVEPPKKTTVTGTLAVTGEGMTSDLEADWFGDIGRNIVLNDTPLSDVIDRNIEMNAADVVTGTLEITE